MKYYSRMKQTLSLNHARRAALKMISLSKFLWFQIISNPLERQVALRENKQREVIRRNPREKHWDNVNWTWNARRYMNFVYIVYLQTRAMYNKHRRDAILFHERKIGTDVFFSCSLRDRGRINKNIVFLSLANGFNPFTFQSRNWRKKIFQTLTNELLQMDGHTRDLKFETPCTA